MLIGLGWQGGEGEGSITETTVATVTEYVWCGTVLLLFDVFGVFLCSCYMTYSMLSDRNCARCADAVLLAFKLIFLFIHSYFV